jgi:hypothetical protein
MIHGQKFCGFRVVAAFLITVIFMILLRFWYVANGLLGNGRSGALRQADYS